MDISVIIPTFNGNQYLKDCVESIVRQSYPANQYEILLVDNCSTDKTKAHSLQLINAYGKHNILRYIYEPIPGLLSARHRGAKEARGDLLIYTDDDVIADGNWLWAIRESFNDPTVKLVTGKSEPNYRGNPPSWLEWFWDRGDSRNICDWLSLLDFGSKPKTIDPLWVWGLNLAIRKSDLLNLGGFHPDAYPKCYQIYQGDGESGLSIKAESSGFKALYHPEARVYHIIPQSRMTFDFFKKRHFFQGICDSYTEIRRNLYDIYHLGKHEPDPIRIMELTADIPENCKTDYSFPIATHGKSCSDETNLRQMLGNEYAKGFEFHREEIKKSPDLVKWVLRMNYWDYNFWGCVSELTHTDLERCY